MGEPITITASMVILALGSLVVLGAIVFGKDKKTRKMWAWIGGVPVVLMIAVLFWSANAETGLPESLNWLDKPIFGKNVTIGNTTIYYTTGAIQGAGGGGGLAGCGVEDTTVTLSTSDKYTTASAGTTHRYSINGAPALTVSNAGTLTASPGDQLKILWGNETDGSYYGAVSEVSIPCAGTKTFTKELVQNGTLTIEVFNEEGNLISDPENETLVAGDVVTLEAKLKGQYQRGFPYGGLIVAEWNNSEIDDVIVDFGGGKTSVPQIYAITYGVSSSTKAYTVPAILSNQIFTGSVTIDADDSTNPTSNNGDVKLKFYPNDYFINEDRGGIFDGPAVEDEDDTQTFLHSTSFTVSVD